MAVRMALGDDVDGSVAIKRLGGSKYAVKYVRTPLSSVAKETTHLPDAFINAAGNDVTKAFVKYALPLAGELPKVALLKGVKVKKKS